MADSERDVYRGASADMQANGSNVCCLGYRGIDKSRAARPSNAVRYDTFCMRYEISFSDRSCNIRVEARNFMEDLLGYANHVGIYSEEISMAGQALGNVPQSFPTIAIISAAFNINRVLDGQSVGS